MEKQIKTGNVKFVAESVLANWDTFKDDIKLNAKALYNLIGLKKILTDQGQQIAETLIQLFESHNCPMNQDGTGFIIAADKQEEMNKLLIDFYNESINITYNPIIINENDKLPADLMDLLFDFIEFQ